MGNRLSLVILKRTIAVALMVCLACVNPLQTLSPSCGTFDRSGLPTVAQAAQKKEIYVSEVRLAADKKADNAKEYLEFAGYEVIDQDLNEEAGSIWNKVGDQTVYMGIRRTADEKKAIRDMKTMNMHGKYSFAALENTLKEHKQDAKVLYDQIKVALAEFKTNYKKGDPAAENTYQNLQKLREDDSGKRMGDLLLTDISEEDLLKILLESNTYLRASLIKQLSIGIDEANERGDTWADRVSKVTSYNAVIKQYSKEIYGKDTVLGEDLIHVRNIAADELDEAARAILERWDDIRELLSGGREIEDILLDFEEEDRTVVESLDLCMDASDTAMAECLKRIKYGKKSLYHLFMVNKKTFEDDITKLYPLVFALSPGQRSILKMIDPTDLFEGTIIRKNRTYSKKEFDTLDKKLDRSIDKLETVSIYEGVDRAMYEEGAAMTSEATSEMYMGADEYNRKEDSAYAIFIFCSMAAVGYAAMGLFFMNKAPVTTVIEEIPGPGMNNMTVDFDLSIYDEMDDIISEVDDSFAQSMGEVTDIGVLKEAQSTGKVPVGNRIFGVAMLVVGVVLLAISIYEYIQVTKKEHNVKQLPIPKTIIDFDTENEAGKYVTYHAVTWNLKRSEPNKEGCGREDRGDLNGDGGKQWLALYTTKDTTMGDPILADSIVCRTGKAGGKNAPSMKHVPLTMFGRDSIQNLVDPEFCYNDEVDGIWMYYKKGTSGQKLEDDAWEEGGPVSTNPEVEETYGEAASGSGAESTGSHIGGTRLVLYGTGGLAGGFILGLLCMYFFKRRKIISDGKENGL